MKMMRPVILLVLLLASCEKAEKDYPNLTAAEINGARLWQRITVETNYDDYPEWPGFEGMQIGQSPHGRYHEIYINPVLRNALPIKEKIAPDGSIIVKENYDADKNNVGYTVMAKVQGYNPAVDDWFWAMFDPNGKVMMEGKPDYCIKCHSGMKPNDYVIVRPLDRPGPATDK
jgi:hypothetical protein